MTMKATIIIRTYQPKIFRSSPRPSELATTRRPWLMSRSSSPIRIP
jgi:hypothetical protein